MTFHVFVTSPAAGVPIAMSPYTVECKEVFNNRNQAQTFANAKTMSPAVVALFDAMPSVHPPWAANLTVTLGTHRAYNGQTWRCIQTHTTQAGWEPPNVPALWTMVPNPGASAWAQPVAYTMPAKCTYAGRLYQLVQGHTSQTGWEPPNVPALWTDIGPATGTAAYTRAYWYVVSSADADYTEIHRAREV